MALLAMEHWSTQCSTQVPHSSFGNYVFSAAAASLKMLKVTKGKHVLHFRPSRQEHAKTHIGPKQIKTVLELNKILGRAEENSYCALSPHFLATPLNHGNLKS